MNTWVENLRRTIITNKYKHIIVADTDKLFDYYEVKDAFEKEDFRVLNSKSNIEARVIYETEMKNSDKKIILLVSKSYKILPDIEEKVHFITVSLNMLFPNLDTQAIKGLSFNSLCMLSNFKLYSVLEHNQTIKFLLENLYNIDCDSLKHNNAKERIINALIIIFLEKNGINEALVKYLTSLVAPYIPELIKERLSSQTLLKYLQSQWENYTKNNLCNIDFTNKVLVRNIGYLFAFQHLKPVLMTSAQYNEIPSFLKIGVYLNQEQDIDRELESLTDYLSEQADNIENQREQWFSIIRILSKAKLLSLDSKNNELLRKYSKVEDKLNKRFQLFIENDYSSLFSLSGVRKPVVVSRILDYINAQPEQRKALIVIDGMNYWQWNILAEILNKENLDITQGASLAFIPTITAWSRQAIFRGEKPNLNEDNSKEKELFTNYWQRQNYLTHKIHYNRFGVANNLDIEEISEEISMLGLVCNDLDDVMHGASLGNVQLKNSTAQWIEQSNIIQLVQDLLKKKFCIYLTSDHGNIEAKGVKNLNLKDKVGTLSRSKRHIYFENEILKESFIKEHPFLEYGLKNMSLYLSDNSAFNQENHTVITHGGSHLWEVIVPFVRINEK
ncbi:MAG: BREX-3 system phosphatase PglZ [Candidatus Cloacimonetes bacterium]|nr:BREX-3 system phosphatase PglZ [Candidatus Cloacimonadota bacterium]